MLPLEHPDRIQIAFDDLGTGWSTMPGCFFRPPWPSTWACVNSLTVTLTSGMRRGGRTRETRC